MSLFFLYIIYSVTLPINSNREQLSITFSLQLWQLPRHLPRPPPSPLMKCVAVARSSWPPTTTHSSSSPPVTLSSTHREFCAFWLDLNKTFKTLFFVGEKFMPNIKVLFSTCTYVMKIEKNPLKYPISI